MFSGSDDKTIFVWEIQSKVPLYTLTGHTRAVRDLLIIPQSGHLLSCAHDGKLHIWRYQSQEIIKTVDRSDHLTCLAFLNLHNIVLIGTEESTIITIPIEPELGNPAGLNLTVDRTQSHMNKKARQKRGEQVEMHDETRSIQSEDIYEEYPDPSEELLKEILERDNRS